MTTTATALTAYPPVGAVAYAANRNDQTASAVGARSDSYVPQTTAANATDGSKSTISYARFVSPVIEFDRESREVVVRHRDPSDGKVVLQIPSEAVLRQYEDAVRRADRQRMAELLGSGEERKSTPAQAEGTKTTVSANTPVDITISGEPGAGTTNATPGQAQAGSSAGVRSGTGSTAGSVTAGAGTDSSGGQRSAGGNGGAAFNLVV